MLKCSWCGKEIPPDNKYNNLCYECCEMSEGSCDDCKYYNSEPNNCGGTNVKKCFEYSKTNI